MSPPWKNIFVEMPHDADIVWIVRFPFFDTPTQAKYDQANNGFNWTDSNGHDLVIPTNLVWKWRPL